MLSNDSCDLQASLQLPIPAPNVGAAIGQRIEVDEASLKEESKSFQKEKHMFMIHGVPKSQLWMEIFQLRNALHESGMKIKDLVQEN
jgi:hypothetical protein